jgi:catechol 2,3-dioxygenase-like lactoylglutathione lyase family enzyme
MTVKRMDHVGVIVDDLEAATAFFVELGLRVVGETSVEGDWVDRIIGLDGARSRIAMLETPDGHSRLELTAFDAPPSPPGDPRAPSNAPGIRHLLFAVDDLDDTLARLRPHGAELVGEIVNYSDRYLMCYLRGPGGIIVELAEELG